MMSLRRLKLFFRRLSATLLDLFLGMALGLLLSNSVVGSFFADRAVVMLRIGNAETIWKGPVPFILGILGPFAYGLPLSMLLILLAEPLTGSSLGKSLFGLKIVAFGGGVPSRRLRWIRSAAKTVFFWGLLAALLSGSWILAICFSVLGIGLVCNMALSVFFSVRPIHETLSRTWLQPNRR